MRRNLRRLLILAALLAIPVVGYAVIGLILDLRVARLSAALDRDIAEISRRTFPSPPLPGAPEEGLAFDFHARALALTPPTHKDFIALFREFEASGVVPVGTLPELDAAAEALDLLARSARTRQTTLWIEFPSGNWKSDAQLGNSAHLLRLATLAATRLLDSDRKTEAVDLLLAAVRLAEDQRRYHDGYYGHIVAQRILRALISMGPRLPPDGIDRAVSALALELSIPDHDPIVLLDSLMLQCSFERALDEVHDDLFMWGNIHKRDALGSISFTVRARGIRGFYNRTTCRARVRDRVPAAWELLREETALCLSRGEASDRFEPKCKQSDNAAIVELGFKAEWRHIQREWARVDLEAAILALLAIRHEMTEGHLPASLEEVRPSSVRPSPTGCRWLLRPHPETDRPAIWLVPERSDLPVFGL